MSRFKKNDNTATKEIKKPEPTKEIYAPQEEVILKRSSSNDLKVKVLVGADVENFKQKNPNDWEEKLILIDKENLLKDLYS